MAIIFLTNYASEFGGDGATDETSTNIRDANYADTEIRIPIGFNRASPVVLQFSEVSTVWFHCRVQTPSDLADNGSDGFWMTFLDASGTFIARIDSDNGDLSAVAYGSPNDTGGDWTPGNDADLTLDIEVSVSGGNTTINVYSNETLVTSASTTSSGAQSGIATIQVNHDDLTNFLNDEMFYSEIIVADEDTRGFRLASLVPDGNGGETDWTGDYTDVLNATDGAAIVSDTAGERETFTLSAYNGPATPANVRGVYVQSTNRKGGSGPQNMRHLLRIGGVNYEGASFTPNGGYTLTEWADDPSASGGWDTADLASLEAGVKSEA